MVNLFRLSCCLALLFIFFAAPFHLKARSFSTALKPHKSVALANQFSTYQVFQLDAKELDTYVKSSAETPAQIQTGNHLWQLTLTHNRIVSENYSLQVSTLQGIITTYPKTNIAYKGYELNGGGKVRLTIHGEFLYGFVEEGIERYYIEPLWYFEPGASHDLFVLYPRSSVRPLTTNTCGFNDESMALQHLENRQKKGTAIAEMSTCHELDFAIASDRSIKHISSPDFSTWNGLVSVKDLAPLIKHFCDLGCLTPLNAECWNRDLSCP